MRPHLQRIHIIGAGGSGKTTLSRQLAAALEVPFYELDVLAYEGGVGRKRSYDERMVALRGVRDGPGWITEGGYLWWIDDLLKEADLVIWLDIPWYVAIWRIIVRHMKASWAGNNRHPGLMNLVRFVWGYRGFYLSRHPDVPSGPDDDDAGNRAAIAQVLAAYSHKVVRCRSTVDATGIRHAIVAGQ